MHVYLLILVTILWGWGVVCIKLALTEIDEATFIFFRFSIASLCMMAILPFDKNTRTRLDIVKGIGLGCLTTGLIFLHTMSIAAIGPSLASFLSGTSVVFVLFINFIALRRLPKAMDVLATSFCIGGLYFITHSTGMVWEWGVAYALGAAFFMSLHTYSMDQFAKNSNIILLSLVQMLIPALFATSLLLWRREGIHFPQQLSTWGAVLFSAFFSAVIAMWLQTYCQKHLSVFTVAVVLLLEPVFATLFSCLFFGDTLHLGFYIGAGMILVSILMINIRLKHM